ncbi:MAG: hypothetical protein HDR44_00570 [Allobaculum sp.]|nr:hypothetical protein [Allobaculum sp.]
MNDDLKWAGLAIFLAVVDGLICHVAHWSLFSSSTFSALAAWSITLLFALVFFVLYFLQKKKASQKKSSQSLIQPLDSTLKMIKRTSSPVFSKEVQQLYDQGLRLQKKSKQLDTSLQDYFGEARLSYAKFATSINGGIEAFQANVQAILARMNSFDTLGYEELFKHHLEYTKAMEPYQECFSFIHKTLQANEEILERFDRLLEEVNALSYPTQNLETSETLQELSILIEQTKRYQPH